MDHQFCSTGSYYFHYCTDSGAATGIYTCPAPVEQSHCQPHQMAARYPGAFGQTTGAGISTIYYNEGKKHIQASSPTGGGGREGERREKACREKAGWGESLTGRRRKRWSPPPSGGGRE